MPGSDDRGAGSAGDDLDLLVQTALESGDRDGDPWWRAVDAFRAEAGSGGIERALRLVAGAEAPARALACDALGQVGAADERLRDRIVPVLVERLGDAHAAVRRAAAAALAHQRDERAVGPLAARWNDQDAEVRHAVAFGLGGFDDPVALRALVDLTRDPWPAVRDWATFAIGSLTSVTTPDIVAALVERLGDGDDQTREEAVQGLVERRGDPGVIEALVGVLADGGRGPLEAAARLGDHRLLPALLEVTAVSDQERLLLEHAIYACSPDEEDGAGI